MKTPKIVHPIETNEFGFYRLYFTLSNFIAEEPLTPKALDVISSICSREKEFLGKKRFKHDLAQTLKVKTPRIYKLLDELERSKMLIHTENSYELPKTLQSLQSNVKYLLDTEQTQFGYEMLFNIKDESDNLNS